LLKTPVACATGVLPARRSREFAANDDETGKTRDMTANRSILPNFPDIVCAIKRGAFRVSCAPSDKPVSRDRPIVVVFNPAETT